MRATYFISFNSGASYSQFYPSNSPKVKLTQEPGEIFFRWRIDSFRITATKNQAVYTTLATWFTDTTKFTTDIYYQIKENGTTTYEFIAPVLKGKLDTQNSVYECIPDPKDEYRDVMLQYERKWYCYGGDAFFLDDDIYYPTQDADQFLNVDFTTFSDDPVTHVLTYTNHDITTEYARKVFNPATTLLTNEVVVIIIKNLSITAGAAPKMRLVDGAFASCSNQVTINANGIYTLTATNNNGDRLEVSQTDVAGNSGGTFYHECYHYHSYKNEGAKSLYEALIVVLTYGTFMNLSIATPISTILWNDSLGSDPPPNIETYITANPNNDYVIEGTQNWNDLWIGRTDIWTTAKNDDFEYSLKDIMDILKDKLRMWWFIDEDGAFRIEHEKYFRDYTAQADLTGAGYLSDKPEVDKKIYNYEDGDLYNQLNYTENNESNEDFIAAPIVYNSLATSGKVKDIRINVSTDMKNVIADPDDISNAAFVLMRCVDMGAVKRIAIDESTKTAGNYYPNAKLGWYYLMANYYKNFAEAETGTVNGGAFTFDHVKEFKKQEGIRFHPAAAIDWKKPFTLAGGTGWLISAEYEPETGMAEINVGFNPYA